MFTDNGKGAWMIDPQNESVLSWYCVALKPQRGHKARENIRALGFVTFDPEWRKLQRRRGRDESKHGFLISGYSFVLAGENPRHWAAIRAADGVLGFLGSHGTIDDAALWIPSTVTERWIEDMRAREAAGEWDYEAMELRRRQAKRGKRYGLKLADLGIVWNEVVEKAQAA